MRVRQIAPVALVLAATLAGSFGARLLGERDARRNSERRAEVAAAQIRDRVEEGSSLAVSLGQFVGTADVSTQAFEINALQWLSPAGLPAAGWVERVPASGRAAYSRRTGQPVVTLDRILGIRPVGPRSSYLPATLVSGIAPMNVPGLDLSADPGFAAALARASASDSEAATPLATLPDGADGLFLIRPAPRLTAGAVQPGFVVLFESAPWLRAAAANTSSLRLATGYASSQQLGGAATVRRTFSTAGQQFDVVVPQESVSGTAAALPWVILAAGLVLAALAGALGANAARRARAQDELDRIFSLSPDLITVANFAGHFTRVNPAAERILGYTQEELLAHSYLDLVHPDDRGKTATEAAAIAEGKTTLAFENRYVSKDGSHRVLEWTSTPVVKDRAIYAVARDVTERRRAETEVVRLADEQAALRRVATLVAREASQAEVFGAIAEEIGRLLDADELWMLRYERGTEAVMVATTGAHPDLFPVGSRWPLGGENVTSRVFRTGRPARVADWGEAGGQIAEAARSTKLRALVGTPVLVRGQLWGTMLTGTFADKPLAPDTESRLGEFTELMAIAIANAEARAEVERLAKEQAALRRVATLAARGGAPPEVFGAVAEEMVALLDADGISLCRYEPGNELTVLAHRGAGAAQLTPGTRIRHDGESVSAIVRRTHGPARMDTYAESGGRIGHVIESLGFRSGVGVPIIVDGRLWGAMVANWVGETVPPPYTEERMAQFVQLLETAIANADSRDQLSASRARLVTEADEARRRVVRDLHDGAQQRLLQTIVTLALAQRALEPNNTKAQALIEEALAHARQGNTELRELAHGILPAVLTQGGLRSGISSIVSRLDLPVEVDVAAERFPAEVEASAYFVVAEALTNVMKHSRAEHAEVRACVEDGMLRVEVRDDGVGGADPNGHGFVGLGDRVTAIGGELVVESPQGGGTRLAAKLPISAT